LVLIFSFFFFFFFLLKERKNSFKTIVEGKKEREGYKASF